MTLIAEFVSCLFMIILLICMPKIHISSMTRRTKYFYGAVSFALFSTIVNIASVAGITDTSLFPISVGYVINCLYFATVYIAALLTILYLFELLYERSHQNSEHSVFFKIFLSFFAVYMVFVVTTPFTGFLFYFTSDNVYVRGPLNSVGYFLIITMTLCTVLAYFKNRLHIKNSVRFLIRVLPLLFISLAVLQNLYPDLLLNGTIAALILIIIFVNFQTSSIQSDSLTECGNRIAFLARVNRIMKHKDRCTIVAIHVHDFQRVNNQFGQEFGDATIISIVDYLTEMAGRDNIFRIGNLSFAMILPPRADVADYLQTLSERFCRPWSIDFSSYYLSSSICYIHMPFEAGGQKDLLNILEYALHDPHSSLKPMCITENEKKRMDSQQALRQLVENALPNKMLHLVYQPIFDTNTREICAAEALLRLTDDHGRTISPELFIPIAEKLGLMGEISEYVLEEVCTFLEVNPHLPLKSVSVNMSVKEVMSSDYAKRLIDCVARHGVDPSRIKIEITEQNFPDNQELLKESVSEIIRSGFGLYLDDFGTGYSNLANALLVPFEVIKIDRSLISNLSGNETTRSALDAFVQFFKSHKYRLVAEGVETETEARLVKEMGISYIQGYLLGRPMTEDALVRLFENR